MTYLPRLKITFMKHLLLLFLSLCMTAPLPGQTPARSADLPGIDVLPDIPGPSEFLGFPFGKWHVGPDQIVAYARTIARLSDRVTIREYARTHEDRPLILLTITSPSNHKELEDIRLAHLASLRADSPEKYRGPVILYQGFSIHGDEASGAHAAMLYLYYLAASTEKKVIKGLEDAIILLDPCLNPDGLQRFSTWANMHRGDPVSLSPFDRQHRQAWPSGRTNHYWFDLNRDWLPAVHPETRGRLAIFHDWKPHLMTDHHEMGPNGTFFFQPGVPSRVHPLIPEENQRLSQRIGRFHAAALDTMGVAYYSREEFDDFYFGKGSTYPDAMGSIGILFEQASARGNAQSTDQGVITFEQAILHHLTVARTSCEGALSLKKSLQDYQVDFFRKNQRDRLAGFRISPLDDRAKSRALANFLSAHRIITKTTSDDPGALFIPLDQPACRLVQSLFIPQKEFTDSLFYDVSSWHLPSFYAFEARAIQQESWPAKLEMTALPSSSPFQKPVLTNALAWLVPNTQNDIGALINQFHLRRLPISVATKPVVLPDGSTVKQGAILIRQEGIDPEGLASLCQEYGQELVPVPTGSLAPGPDLGSPSFLRLTAPKAGLLVGSGVSAYGAGEVWHHLQENLGMSVLLIDQADWDDDVLEEINTLILPHGSYSLTKGQIESVSAWIRKGHTLILLQDALSWARHANLIQYTQRPEPELGTGQRPYAAQEADRRARMIKGISIEGILDPTHPLMYGLDRDTLPMFRLHGLYIDPLQNPYATPLRASDDPLISGYLPRQHKDILKGSASVLTWKKGQGRIIGFADQVLFRGMTVGSQKIFDNALFFSCVLDPPTLQSSD